MVLYPNKLPESERVCSGICKQKGKEYNQISFWYHNNVFSSSMSGRTQKRAVSNSFPVSCLCSQKRYQLDIILLLMDGSSGMMCVIMQPSFCIQEWRETTQQTLGKRKFSCSSFRFSGKCINHILYIHLFIYYIFIYYLYI